MAKQQYNHLTTADQYMPHLDIGPLGESLSVAGLLRQRENVTGTAGGRAGPQPYVHAGMSAHQPPITKWIPRSDDIKSMYVYYIIL